MKKLLLTILVLALSTSLLAACDFGKKDVNTDSEASGVYAFAASSAGAILTSISGEGASGAAAEQGTTEALEQQKIDKVNGYMAMVEKYLAEEQFSVVEQASEREGYQKVMTVSAADLTGQKYSYVLYYNETLLPSDPDDDEGDVETSLDGIMVVGEAEYVFKGETESEEGEKEICFTAKIDDKTFVKIKQEIEPNEQYFSFKVYQNGLVVDFFEIEKEIENGETEIEMRTYNSQNGKTSFKFKNETEFGKRVIKMKILEADGTVTNCTIRIETDANGNDYYNYNFGGNSYKKHR